MKKLLYSLFLFVLSCFTLASCTPDDSSQSTGSSDQSTESSSQATESVGFIIHYYRPDAKYTTYGIWLWEESKAGALYEFNGEDDYGVYMKFEWDSWSADLKENRMNFIVRKLDSWVKDVEEDRYFVFSELETDANGYYNIYLKSQDPQIYTSATGEVNDIIQYFEFSYDETTNKVKLWFQTNKEFSSYIIKVDDTVVLSSETANTDSNVESATSKKVIYSMGSELPDVTKEYVLSVTFKTSNKTLVKSASNAALFKTKAFEDAYTYTGDLGAIYTKNNTVFRVWTPISSAVKLRIYNDGTPQSLGGDDIYTEYNMTRGVKGTWEYTLQGDSAGKYYTYVVTNGKYKNIEVVDPYAKSTGINGLRGMIVDFANTNPAGWENVSVHDYAPTSLTVYETHIADLTSSSTWNGTEENSKLFTGFYESGTKYKNVTTGFDHIKELGVNAVQLLPVFDHANDERIEKREFNWGYNPLNYNSLDGIYSSDPYDGYAKIREFKALVQAYNEAGINIIMDVVYNHMAGLDRSNFDVLMPDYYFRYNETGPSNGSGCGNETASEMSMFRKFMVDSTAFWASEYKLGGFRFDLMGLHDVETMNQLSKNLHENVNESITIYGEPWAAGTSAMSSDATAAMQTAMNQFEGYGCFNDKMRDALIKGGLSSASEKGWITNTKQVSSLDVAAIKAGISGLLLAGNTVLEPEKCVNYVTCHDNYTLYDRIKAAGIKDEATIKQMAMLANSIVFTSQGVTFMLAGEEMLRTKGGDSNSYESSYEVNEINYELKIKNSDFFENYKKLIDLKKTITALSKDGTACKDIKVEISLHKNLIVYDLIDTVNQRSYRFIHSNGFVGPSPNVVDLSGYNLYLDTLNQNDLVLSFETIISKYQTIIAYKDLS